MSVVLRVLHVCTVYLAKCVQSLNVYKYINICKLYCFPFWYVSSCKSTLPLHTWRDIFPHTVYPKKYAHGFCFAVLCCGYTLTDFPISIRLTSLALWQSNDCPSASKATLMNMDKYFMWTQYELLHNHNKAKPNKTVCIFLGIYCKSALPLHTWRDIFPHILWLVAAYHWASLHKSFSDSWLNIP